MLQDQPITKPATKNHLSPGSRGQMKRFPPGVIIIHIMYNNADYVSIEVQQYKTIDSNVKGLPIDYIFKGMPIV